MAFFPNRPRIQQIFLSDEHRRVRVILLGIVLAIAVTALTIGLVELLNVDPGWQEVEIPREGVHCGGDFTFQYNFGAGGATATAQRKEILSVYAQCASDAYWMFTPDIVDPNNANLYTVNHSVGQTVTVNPVLYEALELMEAYGSRNHYLGPVYVVYKNLVFSQSDAEAEAWDPTRNPEQADYVAQLAAFARDEQAVDLELLGDNQVRLQVSDEYLQFAAENEIENFLDFNWMKNAFIIDYFAQTLSEKGYIQGYFVSQDGFTRNLAVDTPFRLNIFDREGDTVYVAGAYPYEGPISAVSLRSYANSVQAAWNYYSYADGAITSAFVDIGDGQSRCATSDLLCYSKTAGCAEILLQMTPAYVRENLDTDLLLKLKDLDVFSIWGENAVLYHTDPDAELTDLMTTQDISYSTQLFS